MEDENDTGNMNNKIGNLSSQSSAKAASNSQVKELSSQHKFADKPNIAESDTKSFASDLDLHSAADGWDDDWDNALTSQLGEIKLSEDKPASENKFAVEDSASNQWEEDLVDEWNSNSDWQTETVPVKKAEPFKSFDDDPFKEIDAKRAERATMRKTTSTGNNAAKTKRGPLKLGAQKLSKIN